MPPRRPTTVDNILEYTATAANALRDIAAALQLPFVGRLCTLTLEIVSVVLVGNFRNALDATAQFGDVEHKV
jgi:hypothetical protein